MSSSRHRLLNLPDARRTTQRWPSVEPALISQTGKNTLYIYDSEEAILEYVLLMPVCLAVKSLERDVHNILFYLFILQFLTEYCQYQVAHKQQNPRISPSQLHGI